MSCRKLLLKTNAAIEIEEAISYYSLISNALAKKFEKEIRCSFKIICENPENYQFRYFEIRVFWLKKFPYGIYYIYDNNEISILSFWHSKEDLPKKINRIL
jgi:plasmid stabilization system protein ParE